MQAISGCQSLGPLVRTERKAQRLTQEQLAGLTGVGGRFVRELEAGKATPSASQGAGDRSRSS
ncbi:helix-turn-helix domain-containing protein [Camelimonas fluminis]|uniref:Helix-turn-helix domain-containing protein n=1 Tax=Camelimonas fluminis TaxID=1576911 RepID=A0ABV7UBJ6_9HYPH